MFHSVVSIAKFTVKEALRSHFLALTTLLVLALIALVEFVGSVAITESTEVKITLLSATLRLAAAVGITVLASSGMVREWHERSIDTVLALPLERLTFALGKLLGFIGIAVSIAGIVALGMLWYADPLRLLLWAMTLICELSILGAATLAVGIVFRQLVPMVLSVLAFYTLARSITDIRLLAQSAPSVLSQKLHIAMSTCMEALGFLLPDLQSFTRAAWLVYPDTSELDTLINVLVQTVVCVGLLTSVALVDLYRKDV